MPEKGQKRPAFSLPIGLCRALCVTGMPYLGAAMCSLAVIPSLIQRFPAQMEIIQYSGVTMLFFGWIFSTMSIYNKSCNEKIFDDKCEECFLERKNMCEECKSERQGNYMMILNEFARTICQEINFDETHSRISIYVINGEYHVCCLCGRHSKELEYRTEGRVKYPFDQGVLGQALKSGCLSARIQANPVDDFDRYCQELLLKYNIPVDITRNLRMQSRSLIAVRIDNDKQIPVAVVVCESTEWNGTEQINADRIRQYQSMILPLIESKCLMPSKHLIEGRNL